MTKNEKNKALFIGKVWPEPGSSAAGSRMMQLVELFRENGWEITFTSAAADSEFAADLEKHGVRKNKIEVNHSSFDHFIKQIDPALVLFDRFMTEEQFGWRVAEHCPDAIRVLDTEDLHCLRKGREKAWKQNRDFTEKDLLSDIAKRELASIYRSDLSLIISEVEIQLLEGFFGVRDKLLHYLPFRLEVLDEDTISTWPDFKDRRHFISLGNFLHEPNWNSVLYLKEEIWPEIRSKLPEADLHIYGAYTLEKAKQLHNEDEGFLIKGRAENALDVLSKARVLLAPLQFGAGIKGKLIDAMQAGTPSVTTDIGAESMHGKLDWPGVIANSPEKIAEAAAKLYNSEKEWSKAQKKGIRIINERYADKSPGKELIQKLEALNAGLEGHRLKNFTGQMLMHHTAASTRFMSKWIEVKNQNSDR